MNAVDAEAPAIELAREKAMFLRWNARQPNPMPVCPRCLMPFQSRDRGDLFPRFCSSCEARLTFRYVQIMIRRWGRKGARAKFAALIRMK